MIAAMLLAAALLDEVAKPARTFVDSIGVNAHFAYADTAYGTRFEAVSEKLVALGIHHVRDGIAPGRLDACARERSLAAHGLHFTFIAPPSIDGAGLAAWAACAGPAIEAIEGPNEYDLTHPATDASWARTLRRSTHALHDLVRANGALHRLPILAPSLTTRDAFRTVGDLSADVDAGNVHDYFGGHEPGNAGYGRDGYGSIAYSLANARYVCETEPVYATETGYGTSGASGDLSEDVAAAYLPRLFLDQFEAGIVRTDAYELVDEGPAPFAHYGLLRGDASAKPAYTALRTLVALFDDPSAGVSARRLRYVLRGGEGSDVRHALFAKADGRFLLALWVERPTVEPHTHLAYPVPDIPLTVTTQDRHARLRAYAYDSDSRLVSSKTETAAATIGVTLHDRVAVVEIRE